MYRFAGYVEWVESGPEDAPFVIDVLGSPGIARELRRLLPTHPIHHRIAQVREVTGPRDLGSAQILYIAAGHAEMLRAVAPAAGHPSMLVVTDEEGGLSAGSALNFLTIDRNVRFEVSLAAAERWGLKISSELLGVAIRVQRGGQSRLGCVPSMQSAELRGGCESRLASQTARRRALRNIPHA